MTINRKIFFLFSSLFIILLGLIYFILKDREQNSILFENEVIKNKVSSLNKILKSKNALLNNIAYEYSKNSNIVDFVKNKHKNDDVFFDVSSKLDISYFLVLDNNKQIVYSEVFDTSAKEYMDNPDSIDSFFLEHDLNNYIDNKDKLKFATIDYEKLIFSMEKIDDLGYVFIAKAINSSFLTDLSSMLDVYVSLLPSYKMSDYIKGSVFKYNIDRSDRNLLYTIVEIEDKLGMDSFFLSVKMKRDIYNEIIQSNKLLLELFFVSFLIFNFAIYIFINKIFTQRIDLISNTVKNISKEKDLVQEIELIYDDEITYLTSKMNEMFKTIHDAQSEHIKKERDFLQSVLDSQQHIIFITDGNEIHSANKKFLDVFKNSNTFMNNIAILDNTTKANLLRVAKKHSSIDKPAKLQLEDDEKYFVFDISRVELRKYIVCMNDVSKYNERILQLQNKATIDDLTGCYNKKTINDYCNYWLEIKEFGLLIIDIDKFKNINDTYGHYIGDCIIRDLANLLKGHLHSDDIIGRFGGEEFIIAINTSIENLENIANRLRELIQNYSFEYEGLTLNITISIGCTYCHIGDDFKEAFTLADEALYVAKNSGRNKVVLKK